MLVGKFRSLITMLPFGFYFMLLASAVRAVDTLGTQPTSSRLAPTILPKRRRESMIMGSHSSQFSPYSRQSAMYSLMAFRTGMGGGPVPALSKYARRLVTGICFLTRSMFKKTPLRRVNNS